MKQELKIKVIEKTYQKKNGKGTFGKFFTPVNIIVMGEEEKGLQAKTLEVKFKKPLVPQKGVYVFNNEDEYSLPYVFEIKEVEMEDGTTRIDYPTCWIRGYKEIRPLPKKKNTSCVPVVDDEENIEDTEL